MNHYKYSVTAVKTGNTIRTGTSPDKGSAVTAAKMLLRLTPIASVATIYRRLSVPHGPERWIKVDTVTCSKGGTL